MSELSLEINNPRTAAGKEVTGSVFFTPTSPIEAKYLEFQFTGKEKVSFKRSSKSCKYLKDYSGKYKLVRIELIIHEWKSGILDPGGYRYPFVFELPYDVPASFNYTNKKASGSISYNIKARVTDIHRIVLLKSKIPIDIVQQQDPRDIPITAFNTPLFTCNCINRGFCTTTFSLSKQRYTPGEYCNLCITVNNSQSRVDINSVECILWLTCRFISNKGKVFYFRKCIFFYQHPHTIKYTDSLMRPKEIPLEFRIAHDKIDLSRCSVTFGKLVQCTYSFQITLEFGSIISEEPDMEFPVLIALEEEAARSYNEEANVARLSRDMYSF